MVLNEEKQRHHFVDYLSFDYDYDNTNNIFSQCSTHFKRFYNNYISINQQMCKDAVNVAVFDFDQTIVDDHLVPVYPLVYNDIRKFRAFFHYIVLWTHGTDDYIFSQFDVMPFKFDCVIGRKRSEDNRHNKGLGAILRQLNLQYGVKSINFSVLLDDTPSNFSCDYDAFVHVPIVIDDRYYKKIIPTLSSRLKKFNKYGKLIVADKVITKSRE
jgi:hypothetical protein